jgi:hypothetical protein
MNFICWFKLTRLNKNYIYLLPVPILLLITYRFWGIGEYTFWQDELALYFNSQRSVSGIIKYCLNFSYHPPLFYFFNKLLITFTGFNEAFIRGAYTLVGIFSSMIPLYFKKVLGQKEAFFFSILLIINSVLIEFSKDALVYSLVTFFITLFICLLHSFLVKQLNQTLTCLIATSIVISYLNYLALIIILGMLFFSLCYNYKNIKVLKSISLCLTIVCLCYIPWLLNNHLFLAFLGEGHSSLDFWKKENSIFHDIKYGLYFIFSMNPLYLVLFFCICIYELCKDQIVFFKAYLYQFILLVFVYVLFLYKLDAIVTRYFIVLVPFSLLLISFVLAKLNSKLSFVLVGLFCLITLFGNKSFRLNRDYQNLKPVLSLLDTVESKVFFLTYNKLWYSPYLENIDNKIYSIDIHCENKDQFIEKLKPGHLLFNISDQCDLNSVLDKLDEKGIRHKIFYNENSIKIFNLL